MRQLLALLFICSGVFVQADVFQLKHVAPSKVLGVISGKSGERVWQAKGDGSALIPAGLTLKANDAKATMEIDGTPEGIAMAKQILEEFDVAPVQMQLRLSMKDPYKKATSTNQLGNNSEWSLEDKQFDVRLSIAPRVNGDGTITLAIGLKNVKGDKQTMVVRVKDGQEFKLQLRGSTFVEDGKASDVNSLEAPVEIRLTINVLEGTPTENPDLPN